MTENPRPSSPSTPLAAVVLAAGKGTRMRSDTHKVLHPVAGRPMLLHLIDTLRTVGAERLVVIVGDRREQIARAVEGTGVILAAQDDQLGTGHATLMAREALGDFQGRVLVCFGDVPFLAAATIARLAKRLDARDAPGVAVLGFTAGDSGAYGRIIAAPDGRIDAMVEAKDASPDELAVRLCNSGVLMAAAADLWGWLGRIGNDNAAGEYYLPDIVGLSIADGRGAVVITTTEDEVAGINSRVELAAAEARFQAAARLAAMDAGVTLIDPSTVHFAYDTALGRDVTVEPFVVFGPGVSVGDGTTIRAHSHLAGATIGPGCDVGPFARLRPGTRLGRGAKVGNFVEVKNATFGEGAKANHLSYIGDANIGVAANIGAGTITCNYDGYFKHRTVIGDRAFIGSNSALVAPVTIGADAIVAAGSALTADVPDGALALVRAPQTTRNGWATRFHEAMRRRKAEKTPS